MKFSPTITRGTFAALVLGVAACHTDQQIAPTKQARAQLATPVQNTPKNVAAAAGGHVSSVDERGIPNFIWAGGEHRAEHADTPAIAAERHLNRFAKAHNLSPSDQETARIHLQRTLRNGAHLLKFRQYISGVEVYPSEVNVLMRANLDLVAITGHLHRVNLPRSAGAQEISYQQALANALSVQLNLPIAESQIVDLADSRDTYRRFTVADALGIAMPEGANVKRIYYTRGEQLEPAYFTEFYAGLATTNETQAYRYIISARDGRVLEQKDLTASDAFVYRVWADATGDFRPYEGPVADFAPHPTGVPDMTLADLVSSNLITMEGFNTNPDGVADPWLPSGARETQGNNVDAYSDDNNPDGYSNGDLRGVTNGTDTFDRTFDFNIDATANPDQIMASVTELFYVTNWLHNWWYDSGFNELAGNAQADNFERGGLPGDVMQAQAQDNVAGGARNNANMSTPSDGLSPRMQMYQWTGPQEARITLSPGGERAAGTAAFGPTNFNINGDVVLAIDTASPTSDGCETISNVAGRIALIDRGTCNFTVKVANAQAAGALGVILADNRPAAAPPGLGGVDPTITIPVLSILQADGNALKAALLAGTVSATLYRLVGIDRDGSHDHTVVTHEWGHYLHHRLQNCSSDQCRAQSEGWADWVALYTMMREGDALNGVYTAGAYATRSFDPNSSYFGIRRTPYSSNLTVNAMMFRHIQDGEPLPNVPLLIFGPNSEVHNAGEIWATMMWEAYTSLLAQADGSVGAPTFADLHRRMADYVVAGLQMTPVDSTMLETRDGILAVAAANSAIDMDIFANAFARRGAGSCAVGPDRYSSNFIGVTESTEVRSRVSFGTIVFDESIRSCDDDGVLDGEERGIFSVTVSNPSPIPLADLSITLTASEAAVLFPAGSSVQVPTLGGFESTVVEFEVALDAALSSTTTMTIAVRADSATSCDQVVTSTVVARVNYDTVQNATFDDVEADVTRWVKNGNNSDDIWNREAIQPLQNAWHGIDSGLRSDTNLESPSLVVSTTDPFELSFDHRFSFEFSGNTYWDGGVIEISPDDGQTWSDISTYVNPGYSGSLTDTSDNPLALREAYGSTNPAWPARERIVLNLGNALAGQTVRVRFRIGTDINTGEYGWEIDNIHFTGITNLPFDSLVADTTVCPEPLVASAGDDQTVDPKAVVFLDASGSASETNLPMTFTWTQLSGPTVSLSGADSIRPFFTAPELGAAQVLVFQVSVSDGTLTETDDVQINVNESAPLVADAGDDQTVDAHVRVILDGTASHTDAALPLTFSWAQTAGPAVMLSDPTRSVVTFDAPAATADTTFTFDLTISDGTRTAVDSVDVVVRAVGPLAANAGPDQTVDVGAVVILDASSSESASGLPLTFAWTQSNGETVTIENASAAVARFTATAATGGPTLEFTVTVSDGTRTETDTIQITVRAAPVVDLTADAGADQSVKAGAVVALDGTASRSTANLPLTFAWAQKMGPTVAVGNPVGAATTFTAPAIEGSASVLVFELTVRDGTLMKSDTVTINVAAKEPTPPAEDGGCGCSTTETDRDSSTALFAIGGLALFFVRRFFSK